MMTLLALALMLWLWGGVFKLVLSIVGGIFRIVLAAACLLFLPLAIPFMLAAGGLVLFTPIGLLLAALFVLKALA